MPKTDLERSHSTWSNFKLTLKSILLVISFYALWIIISLRDKFSNNIYFISSLVIDILIVLLMIISFHKFKR
jgi:hypothetical protein